MSKLEEFVSVVHSIDDIVNEAVSAVRQEESRKGENIGA